VLGYFAVLSLLSIRLLSCVLRTPIANHLERFARFAPDSSAGNLAARLLTRIFFTSCKACAMRYRAARIARRRRLRGCRTSLPRKTGRIENPYLMGVSELSDKFDRQHPAIGAGTRCVLGYHRCARNM
jgi:hypothetical protein